MNDEDLEKCQSCNNGELEKHDTWRRYKTPFNRRLSSEQPIHGTIYKCNNEDCEGSFYNDEENEELMEGLPC